eukprot:5178915-Amphidinium_carterae.1
MTTKLAIIIILVSGCTFLGVVASFAHRDMRSGLLPTTKKRPIQRSIHTELRAQQNDLASAVKTATSTNRLNPALPNSSHLDSAQAIAKSPDLVLH